MTEERLLTAEPGSTEFLEELKAIAEASDHPMDKAAVEGLRKMIKQKEDEEAS